MTAPPPSGIAARLERLTDICRKEIDYLSRSNTRLFAGRQPLAPFVGLAADDELAERVDAFVARLGRLQDTAGERLLPAYLVAMGEIPATMLENLDRAERLGLIASADEWLALRKLRNRLVHEYIQSETELTQSLWAAHNQVPALIAGATAIIDRLRNRLGHP